ncbi:diguanylate cyclase [Massilia sp. YIM B02763]|uniref:sensor domain-containing diguanylate cyclase n=1 Tax=Massilia sp. YIM B02763 TaxID=3050130 RepID=UPI0025B6D5F3|nr:diguanylate cyclase [Massilia sp. YIM B02763]MDN4051921.1 diguanylate cyclase [Massilia sp. YIM B02763]
MRSLLPITVRSRLAVTVGALVLGATLLVGPLALTVAEHDMRAVLGDQQFALLSSAAAFIDDRLEARVREMDVLARSVPPAALHDPRRLQAWLSEREPGALDGFVNVVAFARNGDLVASGSSMPSAQPLTGAGRQYFEETVRRRHGLVSEPFQSRLSGAQIVLVTVPVFDAAGDLAYVLAGRIDLQHSNFLRQIDALKPGRSGYLFLMSADGVVIDHPNRERLMERLDAAAGDKMDGYPGAQRALHGFEGWLHGVDRQGAAIFTYKRLRSTGWVLGARYPSDEAFAPMARMRRRVLAVAAALALLAGGFAWWLVRRRLRPLDALRRKVAAMRRGGVGSAALQADPQLCRRDEIGELARAFHGLVHEREQASNRVRAIADNVPAAIAYVDRDERIVFTNAGFERMLGLAGGACGRTVREALGEAGYARLEPLVRAVLRGERGRVEDVRSDDKRRHQLIDYLPDVIEDDDGNLGVAGFYVLAMDISERKEAELVQAASEQRLRLIADNLPVLICYIDRNHRLGFANATFRAWLGLGEGRVEGMHLLEALGKPGYDGARARLLGAFAGNGVRFEMALQAAGQHRILEWTFVPDRGGAAVGADAGAAPGAEAGAVTGVYALAHDMTRMKEAERRLVQMARVDDLTGIANRRLFNETLARALERARRKGSVLGLAYLDIDHFKRINDTWGHGVGDEVLQEFARRLSASVRAVDTVARLAGDEFVIVLEDVGGVAQAAQTGAQVVEAMRAPFATSAGELAVSASVGITLADAGAGPLPDQERLLGQADAALYEAKRAGRDRFVVLGDAAAPAGYRPEG